MYIETQTQGTQQSLRIRGEMTVATASAMHQELLCALDGQVEHGIEVDLADVSEIDTAGLQLLLLLKRHCGEHLHLINHSPAVLQVLELCQLDSHFGNSLAAFSNLRAAS